MSDLSQHMPYGPPEGVLEGKYLLKAWQPANGKAKRVMIVQAYDAAQPDRLLDEVEVQMSYENRWGVDVGDHWATEKATDELVADLDGEG